MLDKLVTQTWWLAILTLIFITAVGSMLTLYRAAFATFAGTFATGGAFLSAGIVLAIATILLAKHRADLI